MFCDVLGHGYNCSLKKYYVSNQVVHCRMALLPFMANSNKVRSNDGTM